MLADDFELSIFKTVCNSGCVSLLAVKSNAAMNVCAQVSAGTSTFSSYGNIPRSEIARSYGNSVFNLLRHY